MITVTTEITALGGGLFHQTTVLRGLRRRHRRIEGDLAATGGLQTIEGGHAAVEVGHVDRGGGLVAIEGGHVATGDGHTVGGAVPDLEAEGLHQEGLEHRPEGPQQGERPLGELRLEERHLEERPLEGLHREGHPREGLLVIGEPEARLEPLQPRRRHQHRSNSWRSFESRFWRSFKI